MATDALVDVSYRGFVLGKRLRLLQVGPRSAYVTCDAPMPVGTELILAVDETTTIAAQVARVREADSKDGPTGMWLWTDAAETRAQAWWDAHVTAPDPHIPEPAGGRIRTEGPIVTQAEAPPEVEATRVEAPAETRLPAGHQEGDTVEEAPGAREAAAPGPVAAATVLAVSEGVAAEASPGDAPESTPESAVAASPDPDTTPDTTPDTSSVQPDAAGDDETAEDTQVGDDGGYSVEIGDDAGNDTGEDVSEHGAGGRARRARGTEVMTAVELAEVLGTTPEAAAEAAAATSDDSAAEDGEPSSRPREVRRTQVMSAVEVDELLQGGSADEPVKPDTTAKGKSRNKRRRRR